ncbi:MAG TPA: hypothetical protein VK067_04690 [Pseudogracilibacillus sp.]|nr:hypothetical protein [Pseudogracilibacillus sp.]
MSQKNSDDDIEHLAEKLIPLLENMLASNDSDEAFERLQQLSNQ